MAVIILAVFILLMVVLGLLMRNMMLRRKSREMVLHREEYKLGNCLATKGSFYLQILYVIRGSVPVIPRALQVHVTMHLIYFL